MRENPSKMWVANDDGFREKRVDCECYDAFSLFYTFLLLRNLPQISLQAFAYACMMGSRREKWYPPTDRDVDGN